MGTKNLELDQDTFKELRKERSPLYALYAKRVTDTRIGTSSVRCLLPVVADGQQ